MNEYTITSQAYIKNIKKQTRTEKYNFKVSLDVWGLSVAENYEDNGEVVLIDIFEQECLNLKNTNKEKYVMVELGSNHCYYSLLFKHILGKNKTQNIMVEPKEEHLKRGQSQFQLNNCEGTFYNCFVGGDNIIFGFPKVTIDPSKTITLQEILDKNKLESIDILHSDIDYAEVNMLNQNSNFFKNGKTSYLFLSTHGTDNHQKCKEFFSILPNYNMLLEHSQSDVGCDSLLVYNKK